MTEIAAPRISDDALAARRRAIHESGWDHDFTFRQPHNPAFWMYSLLLLIGVYQFVQLIDGDMRTLMPAIVSSFVIWAVFTLPWIWFLHHKDRFHRSTGKIAAVGFAWGAMVATWVMALPGNAAMLSIISKTLGSDVAATWGPSLAAPLVEESSKAAGVVLIAVLARRHIRTAYDGLILGGAVGLGFEIAEDFLYGINAAREAFGIDQLQSELSNLVGRGTYASLTSHTLYSALIGAGIGWWIQNRDQPLSTRLSRTVPLVLAGVGLHFAWDSMAALGMVTIPLTFILALTLIGIVVRWTNRLERPWMADLLAPEVASGLVTEAEITAMVGSPRTRRHHVRSVAKQHGRNAGKAERHILDAELDLVDALAKSNGESSAAVAHAESELTRLRQLADTI